MNKIYCIVSCFLLFNFHLRLKAQEFPYQDPQLSIDERIEDLLGRMSLEEKVGQLSKHLGWPLYQREEDGTVELTAEFKDLIRQGKVGMLWGTMRADPWTKKSLSNGLQPEEAAVLVGKLQRFVKDSTRLGIPIMLAEETPHGHMAIGATVFPTAIGQASTWNPRLIQEMGAVIAREARAVGAHNGYGPVLDLARDPRWSRTEETYGEDRYLVAQMGKAMVGGLQSHPEGFMATLKHFVAYGNPEGGHNGGSLSVGERTLRQHYLYPFQQAVCQVNAGSVMASYNSIDGIPCSANPWLLNTVLKGEWGFDGFVVSDLLSISGLISSHSVASNPEEAAALSMTSGLDVDLSAEGYGEHLIRAVEKKLVSLQQLDQAVRRVLRSKFKLGLFEQLSPSAERAAALVGAPAHQDLALQVARESLVLLKNQDHVLPFSKSIKHIAVIGPNADNPYNQLGDYTAPQPDGKIKTVLDGIREKLGPSVKISYVKGVDIRDRMHSDIPAAVQAAQQADAVVLVLGGSSARDFRTSYEETGAARVESQQEGIADMESGEGFDRSTLSLMGDQLELMEAIARLAKPTALVLIKGRPLLLNQAQQQIPAILDAWYPGEQGGMAIADVLFGDYNPAGRLPITVPRSTGQLPVYYNADKPKRHGYIDELDGPLFPFGYGLSYAKFAYADLNLQVEHATNAVEVKIRLKLKNLSDIDGQEVVQLYLRDKKSSVVTPVKQLCAFRRVALGAGEEKVLEFILNQEDLKLWSARGEWLVEAGDFELEVGASSEDIRLKGEFSVEQDIPVT